MSVHSVATRLLSYDALSRSTPQAGSSAAIRPQWRGSRAQADLFQVVRGQSSRAVDETAARGEEPSEIGELHRPFEGMHRAAGNSPSGSSAAPGERPSPAIALYERVSQYGNNEPAMSTLLKRWNTIMQGGQESDAAVAAFAKAVSQHETSGLVPAVLDVTA